MRRRNVATVIGFAGFALIVVALVGSLGAFVYREMGAMRQRDALNLLNYFQQAMVTKLYDEVSPVDDLAAAFEVDPDDEAWFPRVAGELLEREEVSYVAYVRGDTMAYAYPEEEFGDTVGDDLTSFSYVYTLAKWTDGFVVESSVELSSGENVFLFVRPVNVGRTTARRWWASRSLTCLNSSTSPPLRKRGICTSYGRSALRMAART